MRWIGIGVVGLIASTAEAAEPDYGEEGVVELGGAVAAGVIAGDVASEVFVRLSPSFGYFVSSSVELGVAPYLSLQHFFTPFSGTTFGLGIGPSLRVFFLDQGALRPFVGITGWVGATFNSGESTRGLLGVEGAIGTKLIFGSGSALELGMQLQYVGLEGGSASGSFNFGLGYSVWF